MLQQTYPDYNILACSLYRGQIDKQATIIKRKSSHKKKMKEEEKEHAYIK